MIEKSKYNSYINGSALVNPEPEFDKINYEILRKKKEKKQTAVWRRKYLKNVLVISVLGFGLMINQVSIFNSQKELTRIQYEINEIEKENSSIKLKTIKTSSIQSIEKKANEIGMNAVNRSKAKYQNLSKDYFEKFKEKEDNKSIINTLTNFIK